MQEEAVGWRHETEAQLLGKHEAECVVPIEPYALALEVRRGPEATEALNLTTSPYPRTGDSISLAVWLVWHDKDEATRVEGLVQNCYCLCALGRGLRKPRRVRSGPVAKVGLRIASSA